jgi:ComF family protein
MNFEYSIVDVGDKGLAAMGYGLYERRLIFGLKYGGKTYMARINAQIILDCLKKVLVDTGHCPWLEADVIVPVPLHKKKLKLRGFNQAEKIAKYLGKFANIHVEAHAIARVKNTEAQRALSKKERVENIKNAFAPNSRKIESLRGKKVLLLDDIYTTGATANGCVDVIKQMGAEKIYFLSLLSANNRNHKLILEKLE